MGLSYTKPREVKNAVYEDLVQELEDQKSRVHVVTGSTSGTGFAYAKTAGMKGATVVCLNRKSARVDEMMQKLKEAVPDGKFIAIECDLKSKSSVEQAAQQIKSQFSQGIYALILNAGVMALPSEKIEGGFDVQSYVNHISQFNLACELFPLLEQEAEANGDARIVTHSSGARNMVRKFDPKYFQPNTDLGDDSNGWTGMNGPRWQRYGQTKLANAVFAFALADRLEKKGSQVRACCAHPGLAATSLQTTTIEQGGMFSLPGLNSLFMSLSQSQEDGAAGIVSAGMLPKDTVPSGSFWGPKFITGKAISLPRSAEKTADDAETKEMLWKLSEEAIGKKFNI